MSTEEIFSQTIRNSQLLQLGELGLERLWKDKPLSLYYASNFVMKPSSLLIVEVSLQIDVLSHSDVRSELQNGHLDHVMAMSTCLNASI